MTKESVIRSAALLACAMELCLSGIDPARHLTAQEFTPPEDDAPARELNIGLYGFSTRFGLDFGADQALLSVAFDLGSLGTEQVRLRPSVEIGFANAVDTYVVNAEIIYRFKPDMETAVPYVGFGFGVAGRDNCSVVSDCPDAQLQFALGFELNLRGNLNWLLEYHGEDALNRHRLFVGLATRRGG